MSSCNGMKMKRLILTASALVGLSGCAIHQQVQPLPSVASREICIIENNEVRGGFLRAYQDALSSKNYVIRVLPPQSALDSCLLTSTYTANWRWDLALYMAYADITVYRNGQVYGNARYDAKRGSANMNKFIDADQKIAELVNELYPSGYLYRAMP